MTVGKDIITALRMNNIQRMFMPSRAITGRGIVFGGVEVVAVDIMGIADLRLLSCLRFDIFFQFLVYYVESE